jgi:hypothetical protein
VVILLVVIGVPVANEDVSTPRVHASACDICAAVICELSLIVRHMTIFLSRHNGGMDGQGDGVCSAYKGGAKLRRQLGHTDEADTKPQCETF